jgi:hypothetical protein
MCIKALAIPVKTRPRFGMDPSVPTAESTAPAAQLVAALSATLPSLCLTRARVNAAVAQYSMALNASLKIR